MIDPNLRKQIIAIQPKVWEAYSRKYDELKQSIDYSTQYIEDKLILPMVKALVANSYMEYGVGKVTPRAIGIRIATEQVHSLKDFTETYNSLNNALIRLTPEQIEIVRATPYDEMMPYDQEAWEEAQRDFLTMRVIMEKFITDPSYRAAMIDCIWYATKDAKLVHAICSPSDAADAAIDDMATTRTDLF